MFRIEVDCSSGTYVRTLAADLGTALGGGAHLRDLRRTAIGSFTLDEARPVEALDLEHAAHRRPRRCATSPSVTVDDDVAAAVAHGKVLDRERLGVTGDGPVARRSAAAGALLAVYEPHRGTTAKPSVVLARTRPGPCA